MKVSINTWQRTQLSNIISQVSGTAGLVWRAGKILERLEISEEEGEEVGLTILPGGELRWANIEHRWNMEFSNVDSKFIQDQLKRFGGWRAANYKDIEDLFTQFEIEVK